jgi:hypothetical protein
MTTTVTAATVLLSMLEVAVANVLRRLSIRNVETRGPQNARPNPWNGMVMLLLLQQQQHVLLLLVLLVLLLGLLLLLLLALKKTISRTKRNKRPTQQQTGTTKATRLEKANKEALYRMISDRFGAGALEAIQAVILPRATTTTGFDAIDQTILNDLKQRPVVACASYLSNSLPVLRRMGVPLFRLWSRLQRLGRRRLSLYHRLPPSQANHAQSQHACSIFCAGAVVTSWTRPSGRCTMHWPYLVPRQHRHLPMSVATRWTTTIATITIHLAPSMAVGWSGVCKWRRRPPRREKVALTMAAYALALRALYERVYRKMAATMQVN